MAKTFEELHPDIVSIIDKRGYETSVYERKVLGNLVEYWEKDKNGVWHNITQRELNRAKSKEMLRKLLNELHKANKEVEDALSGENSSKYIH